MFLAGQEARVDGKEGDGARGRGEGGKGLRWSSLGITSTFG